MNFHSLIFCQPIVLLVYLLTETQYRLQPNRDTKTFAEKPRHQYCLQRNRDIQTQTARLYWCRHTETQSGHRDAHRVLCWGSLLRLILYHVFLSSILFATTIFCNGAYVSSTNPSRQSYVTRCHWFKLLWRNYIIVLGIHQVCTLVGVMSCHLRDLAVCVYFHDTQREERFIEARARKHLPQIKTHHNFNHHRICPKILGIALSDHTWLRAEVIRPTKIVETKI